MEFKLTRYTGADQIAGHQRYALEYGPILMAAVGRPDAVLQVKGGKYPEDLIGQIRPKPGEPLHFSVEHNPDTEYVPYWQMDRESFTCFPVVDVV
jgi:hypothetical protein